MFSHTNHTHIKHLVVAETRMVGGITALNASSLIWSCGVTGSIIQNINPAATFITPFYGIVVGWMTNAQMWTTGMSNSVLVRGNLAGHQPFFGGTLNDPQLAHLPGYAAWQWGGLLTPPFDIR